LESKRGGEQDKFSEVAEVHRRRCVGCYLMQNMQSSYTPPQLSQRESKPIQRQTTEKSNPQ
jgi:hypothetical protein